MSSIRDDLTILIYKWDKCDDYYKLEQLRTILEYTDNEEMINIFKKMIAKLLIKFDVENTLKEDINVLIKYLGNR